MKKLILVFALFTINAFAAPIGERPKLVCGKGAAGGAVKTVFLDIPNTSYKMLLAGTDGGAGYSTFVDMDRNAYTPPSGKKAIVDCIKWMNTDNVNTPTSLSYSTAAVTSNWEGTAPAGNADLWGTHNSNVPILIFPSPTQALYGYHPVWGIEFNNGTYLNQFHSTASGDAWLLAFVREVNQ
jgi:hypothetical protein